MSKRGKPPHDLPGYKRIGFARSVAELVPRVGRKSFRKFGFVESAIVARWAEIVGQEVSRRSTPDSIRFPQGKRSGGTLNLSVHGAHALALQHEAPIIIERVNRYFGYAAVTRMAIRQGEPVPARPVSRRRDTAQPVSSAVKDELKVVRDDDLRNALESLASQIGSTKGPPKIG
ncbi:DUF721 domain-containing protein [Pacificimonas sp. WHA3]|uniref:DUF721 domain-containing protein n=1 Tax=Pacificimonas pallii TaxID=2827236 RepID=A0ABS6SED9_9SPHN|nr:DciA family protein [Pacificimonas pallii]MBV7256716.1 DUF721 domain-containing protein [Pacificimonas pallii]